MRIHWIQYLLVGAALCLFYLLELSLSEHIGFIAAYVLASAAVVGLVATYGVAVLKGVRRAILLSFAVAVLYAYLFVLLNNQDYALLVGSVGLFVILAVLVDRWLSLPWPLSSGLSWLIAAPLIAIGVGVTQRAIDRQAVPPERRAEICVSLGVGSVRMEGREIHGHRHQARNR